MNPLCFWNKRFLLSTENFLENKQNTFFYFGAKTEHYRPRSGTQTVASIAYHRERANFAEVSSKQKSARFNYWP